MVQAGLGPQSGGLRPPYDMYDVRSSLAIAVTRPPTPTLPTRGRGEVRRLGLDGFGDAAVDDEALHPGRHPHSIPLMHRALQQEGGERVLQAALDYAF